MNTLLLLLHVLVFTLEMCRYSHGQLPFPLRCELRDHCQTLGLPEENTDANSDSQENFHCNPSSIPSGMRTIRWVYSHWGDSGGAGPVTPFPDETADNFIRDELTLRIQDVTSAFEGIVFCKLTGDTETATFSFCFYVHGLGVFESCKNLDRGCTDIQQISAVPGGIATFEIRLIFRRGGVCTNQAVRLLSLQKDSNPESEFTCSNIAGFAARRNCNDGGNISPRYRSVQLENCTEDCKYYIDVQLLEVNSSDAGNYTATVTLVGDDTNTRMITKRFTLSITDPTTSIATTQVTTTEDSTSDAGVVTSSAPQGNSAVSIGVGVGLCLFVIAVVVGILLAILFFIYKQRSSKDKLDMTQQLQADKKLDIAAANFYNNHTDSTLSLKTGVERKDKAQSFIETVSDLPITRESEIRNV